MRLFEIMLPVADNRGKVFSARHNATFEGVVRGIAGGLTKYPPVQGQWLSHGWVYSEKMRPVRIATSLPKMRKIAILAKKHYRQVAVMFVAISPVVTFV